MERVILEVKTGPMTGKRFLVEAGRELRVGRSDLAQLAIPHDIRLSKVHFGLEPGPGTCRLRDLNSTNGTFLNGHQVTEAGLRDGDTISAGSTDFVIHIETLPPAAGPT